MTNDSGYNVRSEVIGELMGANDYSYAYDPIGNRLTATNNGTGWHYLSNPLNQYTNIADGVIVEPEYDLDGNMNAAGDGWWYFWNGENRMILASNDTTVVTYAYDHQGRMVAKTVNDVARQYLWDGHNIVQALTHSQTLSSGAWTSPALSRAPAASAGCWPRFRTASPTLHRLTPTGTSPSTSPRTGSPKPTTSIRPLARSSPGPAT